MNNASREFGEDIFNTGVKITTLTKGFTDADRAAKAAKNTVSDSGKGLEALGLKATDTQGRLEEFAQRIAAITDPVKRFSAVADVFGAKLALKVEPVLIQIAANLREFGNAAGSAIPALNELELAAGLRLDQSLDKLGTTILRTRDHIRALFSDPVAGGANKFNDFITKNREQIQAFIKDIVDRAIPVIEDLINAVVGNDAAVRDPAILEWRDAVVQFGTDVRAVVEGVIIPLFRAVRDAAQFVADGINRLFGSDITAGQVILAVAIGKVLSPPSDKTFWGDGACFGSQFLGGILAGLYKLFWQKHGSVAAGRAFDGHLGCMT